MDSRLAWRLRNWGNWLNFQTDIGPPLVKCVSIESRHIAEAGEVWEDEPSPPQPIPDVTDAEQMEKLISGLGLMERYCLAVRYAGYPAVIRMRRVGDRAMDKLADNGEILLFEMLRKRA